MPSPPEPAQFPPIPPFPAGGGIFDCNPAELGGTVECAPGGHEEDLIGPLASKNGQACIFTVSFDVEPFITIPDAADHRLVARFLWGSRAGKGTATVDVRHGTRVTLEGSNLRVVVALLNDTGPTLRVHGSVGYGSVGKDPPLTLTGDSFTLPATRGSGKIRIPKYAASLIVASDHDPLALLPAPKSAVFYQAGGAAPVFYEANGDGEIIILNGAEFVELQNGAVAQKLTPIFRLTL